MITNISLIRPTKKMFLHPWLQNLFLVGYSLDPFEYLEESCSLEGKSNVKA